MPGHNILICKVKFTCGPMYNSPSPENLGNGAGEGEPNLENGDEGEDNLENVVGEEDNLVHGGRGGVPLISIFLLTLPLLPIILLMVMVGAALASNLAIIAMKLAVKVILILLTLLAMIQTYTKVIMGLSPLLPTLIILSPLLPTLTII